MEEKMRSKKIFVILPIILVLLVLLVACSKGEETSGPAENPIATQGSLPAVQKSPVSTKAPLGVPEDVPVMPDAYDLKIPNEVTVYYKVDKPLQDVVTFYNEELPNYGWEQPKNPDSAVGAMAQMARSKSDGDRITFSIQYNPVGEFTIVQISLTRAP
jgi:hypothetical protein